MIDLRKEEMLSWGNSTGKVMVLNPLNGKNLSENCHRWKEVGGLAEWVVERLGGQERLEEGLLG